MANGAWWAGVGTREAKRYNDDATLLTCSNLRFMMRFHPGVLGMTPSNGHLYPLHNNNKKLQAQQSEQVSTKKLLAAETMQNDNK